MNIKECVKQIEKEVCQINGKAVIEEDKLLLIISDFALSPEQIDKIYDELTNNNIKVIEDVNCFSNEDNQVRFAGELAYSLQTSAIELIDFHNNIETNDKSKSVIENSIKQVKALLDSISFSELSVHTGVKRKITLEMTAICYQCSKKLYNKQISLVTASEEVSAKTGMNQASAFMYIDSMCSMLSGTIFKRAMSQMAYEYALENIFKDYGKEKLLAAINATEQHLRYLSKAGGSTQKGSFEVCEKIRIKHLCN